MQDKAPVQWHSLNACELSDNQPDTLPPTDGQKLARVGCYLHLCNSVVREEELIEHMYEDCPHFE